MPAVYLGGDPRKEQHGDGKWGREGKEVDKGCVMEWATSMGHWAASCWGPLGKSRTWASVVSAEGWGGCRIYALTSVSHWLRAVPCGASIHSSTSPEWCEWKPLWPHRPAYLSCPSFGDSSFDGSLVGYQAAVPPSPWACCIQKGAWREAWCPERVQPPPINRINKQEVGRPGPSSEVGVEARASLSQNVLKMTVRVRNAWAEGRKRQMMSPVSGT